MKKPILMMMVAGMFAFASCESNTENRTEVEAEEGINEMEGEAEEVEGEIEEGAEGVEREIEQ